jgi:hypothetical protein
MKLVGASSRNPGRPDLSSEEYDAVRKLIEELKRLYGRMSECLNDPERREGIFLEIIQKQDEIAGIVPHASTAAAPGKNART